MNRKILSMFCCIMLIFSTLNVELFADNVTQNSTPSTSTNISDGEDFTQGEKTIYNNGTTLDASESTEVYVSQSSTFAAMIPKVIVLDGHGGNATYEVYAKGNIGGTENVYIIPQDTFQLNDVKNIKSSLNGTIVQTKTTFSWNDVMNEQKSTSIGNILVNNISAGNWSGSFNFNIYLKDTSTHIESITLVDESIINEETNAIQIQSSSNKEIPISIYPSSNVDTLDVSSDSPYINATLEEIEVSPIANANSLIDNLLMTNNVFAENETSKNVKLKVQVSENAPCNLNATITIKSRAKILEIPIFVEHSYDNGTITQESNCVTNGIKAYTCTKCNHVRYDETQANGHILNSEFTIDIEPTCTTSGEKSIHCSLCDYKEQTTLINMLEHNYNGIVTTQPTCTSDGVKTYTCVNCQNSYTESLIKLNHSFVNGICSLCGYTIKQTFNYVGNVQEFVAPISGTYQLEVYGANGGTSSYSGTSTYGGKGGYSKGTKYLEKGAKIYIVTGGIGGNYYADATSDIGGYNGGGYLTSGQHIFGAPGGGATSITTTNRGVLSNFDLYRDEVLIVAGGGGGANTRMDGYGYGAGGDGGGLIGDNGNTIGQNSAGYNYGYGHGVGGGQIVAGSERWYKNGTLIYDSNFARFGGAKIPTTTSGSQSGGGGGWYGGGAGNHGGGAGGSSYIDGVDNGETKKGINIGNGYAIVTIIE